MHHNETKRTLHDWCAKNLARVRRAFIKASHANDMMRENPKTGVHEKNDQMFLPAFDRWVGRDMLFPVVATCLRRVCAKIGIEPLAFLRKNQSGCSHARILSQIVKGSILFFKMLVLFCRTVPRAPHGAMAFMICSLEVNPTLISSIVDLQF